MRAAILSAAASREGSVIRAQAGLTLPRARRARDRPAVLSRVHAPSGSPVGDLYGSHEVQGRMVSKWRLTVAPRLPEVLPAVPLPVGA